MRARAMTLLYVRCFTQEVKVSLAVVVVPHEVSGWLGVDVGAVLPALPVVGLPSDPGKELGLDVCGHQAPLSLGAKVSQIDPELRIRL